MKTDSTIPKTKRPTISSVRAFIRNNQGKLFINVRSGKNFISIRNVSESWQEAQPDTENPLLSLGIVGARFTEKYNTVSHLDIDGFVGYSINNPEATFYLAIKINPEPQKVTHSPAPWSVDSSWLGEDIHSGRKVIATVYRFANDEGEGLKNAKLMSNAIVMLDLLKYAAEGRDIKAMASHFIQNLEHKL